MIFVCIIIDPIIDMQKLSAQSKRLNDVNCIQICESNKIIAYYHSVRQKESS